MSQFRTLVEGGLVEGGGHEGSAMTGTATETDPILPFDTSVGYQIRLTHRLMQRALQTRVERHGVTLGMWYYLRALWNRDGLTQSELSALIGTMEPTTLSAVVAMEQAGLVRRERNGKDRRKINVFLTEKGRALRTELLPEGIAVVETAIRSFSRREVGLILSMLREIQVNLAREFGEGDTKGRWPDPASIE